MPLTHKQVQAIDEVRKYIDSMPLQRISIPDLMAVSGLSKDKLTRGFKNLFGETVFNYQVRQSIKNAAELLRQGILVKSVALAVGYKTPGNFTRAFFKVMKVTPSQYQTESRQQ